MNIQKPNTMATKSKSKTEKILSVLLFLSWLGFVGYAITCGSQLISVAVSLINPAASRQIPGVAQNLSGLMQYNIRYYSLTMVFVIALSGMFAFLWYEVVTLLSKLNIKSPFTVQVSKKLERIAYWLLCIWVVGFIGETYVAWIAKGMGTSLNIIKVANEFLFSAGIVYIISQVFKQGIEIQEENQQTI
jgi:hypothetical protein